MKKVVIFDFDGVIVDSIGFSFKINQKFNPNLTWEEFEEMHMPLEFYAKYQENGKVKNTVNEFYEHYEKKIYNTEPVDGMSRLIDQLSKKYHLVLVSGSPARIIQKYLEKYDLRHYFEELLGKEFHLSKVEKINKIKEIYEVDRKSCLMITDSVTDIKAAKKTDLDSIAVVGIHNKKTLYDNGAVEVPNSPEEILRVVDSYFN